MTGFEIEGRFVFDGNNRTVSVDSVNVFAQNGAGHIHALLGKIQHRGKCKLILIKKSKMGAGRVKVKRFRAGRKKKLEKSGKMPKKERTKWRKP